MTNDDSLHMKILIPSIIDIGGELKAEVNANVCVSDSVCKVEKEYFLRTSEQ